MNSLRLPQPGSQYDPLNEAQTRLLIEEADSQSVKINPASNPPGVSLTDTKGFIIDGGGSTITTGIKLDIGPFDFAMTLQAVTLLADQSGSIVLDFWVKAYASYPPTVADTICAAALPTITTALKSQDTTLSGWTVLIPAGRTLRVNVNSVTSIQRLGVALKYLR